jgi:hypothetical protein
MHAEGSACGMLEDTRKAKRLILLDGSELLSAHLSCFAYSDVSAGAELVRAALTHAGNLGFPALFVGVPALETGLLCHHWRDLETLVAPAVVYGVGFSPGLWNVNTSEI